MPPERALRIGIGGPVGSGKSSLVAALCRALGDELAIGVVTNDIYTTEDALFLRRTGVLPPERILAVETGGCPHTAIRDDVSANLEAVAELERETRLDLVLVESGGDNLTAIFSPALADVQIFVIDVAGGDDIPRKGGPGITRSDLLVINKEDLAALVGSDLDRMRTDARDKRGDRPVQFLSLRRDPQATPVAAWVRSGSSSSAPASYPPPPRRMTTTNSPRPRPLARPAACASGRAARRALGARARRRPRPVRGAAQPRARWLGRVVLVQTIAGPLAGDRIEVDVEVGPGAALELATNAATLAFPAPAARHEVRARLEAGARLAWLPAPLILRPAAISSRSSSSSSPRARPRYARAGRARPHGEEAGPLHASSGASSTAPAPPRGRRIDAEVRHAPPPRCSAARARSPRWPSSGSSPRPGGRRRARPCRSRPRSTSARPRNRCAAVPEVDARRGRLPRGARAPSVRALPPPRCGAHRPRR